MEPQVVGCLGIVILVLLLLLKVHIMVCMMVAGLVGLLLIIGAGPAFSELRTAPYEIVANYNFAVLPLFTLMGMFAFHGGLSETMYRSAEVWLGRVPGGLVLVTIASCTMFAAMCGSSMATAVVFTRISLDEMLKRNYEKGLASGVIAMGGTLAVLIPPSGVMILYGLLTDTSISRLFMGGILPGLFTSACYAAMIITRCARNPKLAPLLPGSFSWKERISAVGAIWGLPMVVVAILGSMFTGVCTVTEAAAIGALAVLGVVVIQRGLTRRSFEAALRETGRTSAMIFAILVGAIIFSRFLAVSRIPSMLIDLAEALPVAPIGILIFIIVIYVLLGCILEIVGMLALTLPVVFPLVVGLGFDPIFFGIIVVKMCEIGAVTPPVGLNLFAVQTISGGKIGFQDVTRGALPFLAVEAFTVTVLVAFPQIIMFLPNLMAAKPG